MYKLFIVFFLVLFHTGISFAFNIDINYEETVSGDKKVGEVVVNNKVIMKLYDYVDSIGPYRRAAETARRLTQFVALGLDVNDIELVKVKGYLRAVVGDRFLFTVGPKEASVVSETPDKLGAIWLARLQEGLKDMPKSNVKLDPAVSDIKVSKTEALPKTGYASWYDGNPDKFVAKHPNLPKGTKIRVKNTKNGWTVVVEIIDNEELPGDRIINVSKAAARALGLISSGVSRVRLSRVY